MLALILFVEGFGGAQIFDASTIAYMVFQIIEAGASSSRVGEEKGTWWGHQG